MLREPQLCHNPCPREYVLWPPVDTSVAPALCLRVLNGIRMCAPNTEHFDCRYYKAAVPSFVGSYEVPGQIGSCFPSPFIFRGKDIKNPFIKNIFQGTMNMCGFIKEASTLMLLSGPGAYKCHDVVTQKFQLFSAVHMNTTIIHI